ncbi:MAG: alpha-amylase family protein [bacterium]
MKKWAYFLFSLASFCILWAQDNSKGVLIILGEKNTTYGLTCPSGGDGVNYPAEIQGVTCRFNDVEHHSYYIYFQIDDSFFFGGKNEVYITVEYFDDIGPFTIQYDAYDNPYKELPMEMRLGSYEWQKITFHITDARFSNRQNWQADFRIFAPRRIYIHSVEVSEEKPKDYDPERRIRKIMEESKLKPLEPVKNREVTFGNDATESQAALFKALGVTSVESYVTWESVEPEKDKWNWERWDKQVEILKKYGLKWVPFLIVGPAYATPKWFRETDQHLGAVCLEHNIASKIESIWNPNLPKWIERFLSAFANRYGKTGVIESVLIGISGDYGEAIFPVWGGGWTFQIPGVYHTHPGYWCGDEFARKSFREAMEKKYKSIEKLNEAWGTSFPSFEKIQFPPLKVSPEIREDAPTPPGEFVAKTQQDRRRWLDFVSWYRGEMTRWADWWLATTKKYFPDIEVYLCTGGDAVPPHGSDFAEQCKVAGKNKAGVRITNEASDYAWNFYLTHWVASAGKFYGAFYGFEPASGVNEKGIVARIYNVVASGARQLHEYNTNIISSEERINIFRKNYPFLEEMSSPKVDVAVLYPKTSLALRWADFPQRAAQLRDILDFDFLDETMLKDGALKRYKFFLIISGDFIEKEDLALIRKWVENGGVLFSCGVSRMATVEGDYSPFDELFSRERGVKKIGKGKTIYLPLSWEDSDKLFHLLVERLREEGCPVPDGVKDGVYTTLFPHSILLLNTNDSSVEKNLVLPQKTLSVELPPNSITKVKLD